MRILLLLLVSLAAAAQNQAVPSATGNGFVGSDVCKTCHADVWFNFYKNPHYKSIASGKETPERTGCEGCHGPAQDHVAAGGGKATIPHAFSLMQPKQALEACLSCHARSSKANIRRSEHTQNDVACTSCHSIHHSATPKYLLAKKQSELCYTCHATIRAVRHALQASRQRGLHAVHGLPQSARSVRADVGHGPAPAHGGAGRHQ